jgi:hypothetical protein
MSVAYFLDPCTLKSHANICCSIQKSGKFPILFSPLATGTIHYNDLKFMELCAAMNLIAINLHAMKNSFSLSIPKPCHEKFGSFNKTRLGGFCSSCQKEVIDFTSWEDEKIIAYFKNHTGSACGRFQNHQLKKYTTKKPDSSRQHTWLSLSLLSASLLLTNHHATAQETKKPRQEAMGIKIGEVSPKILAGLPTKQEFTGSVVSSTDTMALPGVTVRLKGTDIETTTNEEGKFVISVDNPQPSDTLVFTFIGFESSERNIFSITEFPVAMKEDLTVLGGIVSGLVIECPKWWSPKGLWWRVKSVF